MQVQVTIDIDLSAKAVLRNGKLSVDLTCAMGYGTQGRSVSIGHAIGGEAVAPIESALQAALDIAAPTLLARARAAADEAYRIAVNKGEE